MDTLHTLVVAHDLSQPAHRALELAQILAQAHCAELWVVHAFDGTRRLGAESATTAYLEFLRYELENDLRVTLGHGHRAHLHVLRGAPTLVIPIFAAQNHADLVVMGRSGKGGVSRALLGSVSASLLESGTLPLLLVP